jgi:ACR3 family arsenite transporter
MDASDWLGRHRVAVYAGGVALAVGFGVGLPSAAPLFERATTPVLAVLLYVTFLEIALARFRGAFTDARFVGTALAMNFLVVPVVVYALTRWLPQDPVVRVGVFMVLLTPCVDYVIAFTDLAGGDAEQVTATTPALLVVQFLLLPAYLWLFTGGRAADAISAGPFVDAFPALIAAPLALALPPRYALVPAVVVTQTLVELAGMVALTRLVPERLVPGAPEPIAIPGFGGRG